jgi:hypothetical protein
MLWLAHGRAVELKDSDEFRTHLFAVMAVTEVAIHRTNIRAFSVRRGRPCAGHP